MSGDNAHFLFNPIVWVDEDEILKTRLCDIFGNKQKAKTQLRGYHDDLWVQAWS